MIYSFDPSKPLPITCPTGSGVILVGGCFDVLHYGHLKFLQEAKSYGEYLLIALESDAAIVKTKDRRVFHTQQQRAEILQALDVVSDVLMLPLLTSDQEYIGLVTKIKPSVIAITSGDPRKSHKQAQADMVGGRIVEINYVDGFSTTDLLHKYCTF